MRAALGAQEATLQCRRLRFQKGLDAELEWADTVLHVYHLRVRRAGTDQACPLRYHPDPRMGQWQAAKTAKKERAQMVQLCQHGQGMRQQAQCQCMNEMQQACPCPCCLPSVRAGPLVSACVRVYH